MNDYIVEKCVLGIADETSVLLLDFAFLLFLGFCDELSASGLQLLLDHNRDRLQLCTVPPPVFLDAIDSVD